jgi:TRAP transporter TAXI family solute receptor
MRKKIVAIVYGIMIVLLAIAFFQNREGHPAKKIANGDGTYSGSLTWGTASSTGTFYYVGAAMGNAIADVTPLNINVQATSGSNENISMVLNNDIDLGMANCDSIYGAYNGTMSYQDAGPQEKMREVASLYQSQLHIFTTASSGIKDISDLKGKKVCVGSQGTSYLFINEKILNAYGIQMSDIHPYYMNYAESAEALANGDIDAAFQTGGYPIAGIQQSAATTAFTMLPISDEVIDQIKDEFPFIEKTEIPADAYEHQANDSAVATLGYATTVFCSEDADPDLIYEFVKGMMEALPQYQDTNDATRQISADTVATEHIPLHEGAERYYKEAGIEIHKSEEAK